MKKFVIAGLAIIAMFCLAELYYRSRDQGPKTPIPTSSQSEITVNTTATVNFAKKSH
ncbi:MAG: hypothetical protein AAB484_00680 [Patescibacteria group bacterium]